MNTQATHGPSSEFSGTTTGGLIELRLRNARQLFDSLDPSPFRERDIDPKAEDYIVESVHELPSRCPRELVIYLEELSDVQNDQNAIGNAIRAHFRRKEKTVRRRLHDLLRRGIISLGIGMLFLITLFLVGRLVTTVLGPSAVETLLRESLLIAGWVAMWRPLEIFLYDWWPIVGERRMCRRLSQLNVRIMSVGVGSAKVRCTPSASPAPR